MSRINSFNLRYDAYAISCISENPPINCCATIVILLKFFNIPSKKILKTKEMVGIELFFFNIYNLVISLTSNSPLEEW